MSQLPASVQLGPFTLQVLPTQDLGPGVSGTCDLNAGTVAVLDGMSPELTRSTLLHELIHAVSDMFGVGLSERQVVALEGGLGLLLYQNPGLASFLTPPRA